MKSSFPLPASACWLALKIPLLRGGWIRTLLLQFVIGFSVVAISADSFGQGTNAIPFIRVNLHLESAARFRRNPQGDWTTNIHSWDTSVIIGSNQWRIESGMPKNALGLWFCDGTNVFYKPIINYSVSDPNSPTVTVKPRKPNSNVVVIPGTHPLGDFGVNLVWLACCSGDYLRSTNRLLPLPGGEPRHDIKLFGVEDKTVLSESPPFLPENIEFLVNNGNMEKAADTTMVFRSAGRRPLPFRGINGMPAATYHVDQFTNYAGWTIPVSFTYGQSAFPESATSSGVGYFVTGTLTKTSKSSPPQALLENGRPSFVEDTRFRYPDRLVDSLRYWWTNAVLPATNDPAKLAEVERLAKKRPVIQK